MITSNRVSCVKSGIARHLTAILAVALVCGLFISVSQRRPATVDTSIAAPTKAAAKPAPKPVAKPKPKPKPRSQFPTPAEERDLLSFLKKQRREFYDGLMAQKKTSDKRYRGTLKFAWQWYKRYKDLDKAVRSAVDREQKARIEISKILGKIKKASAEQDIKKLRSELVRQAAVQFDAQLKVTKYKLDQAQNQLSRLRKELSNRHADRKKIVEQRVDEWMKSTKKTVKKPAKK